MPNATFLVTVNMPSVDIQSLNDTKDDILDALDGSMEVVSVESWQRKETAVPATTSILPTGL